MTALARLIVLTALGLAACAEDSQSPSRVCGEEGCSGECEQLRGDNCDIREPACQRRVFEAVVCVRGTPGEMPAMRTITPDEYRDELLERGDDDAGVEARAAEQAWSAGLALLGLLDRGESVGDATIDDQVENVAGYYRSDQGAITLIDRGRPEDSDDAQATLAHELVHALQDQEMGLAELLDRTGRSNDSRYARSCLVEGEATLYEDLAISLLRGLQVDPAYWDRAYDRALKYGRRQVAIAASPYAALWQLSYPVGARFLTDAWLAGGNRAVLGQYWAAPQSAIYWMHGYAAVTERMGQLVRPLACDAAQAPSGYAREWGVSMGPFAVYAFLSHALVDDGVYPSEQAWQDALLWRQDSLSIFVSDERSVAVSWRILFESDAAAERVARQLRSEATVELATFARGAEIEVLASDAPPLLDAWQGTSPEACPVPED